MSVEERSCRGGVVYGRDVQNVRLEMTVNRIVTECRVFVANSGEDR